MVRESEGHEVQPAAADAKLRDDVNEEDKRGKDGDEDENDHEQQDEFQEEDDDDLAERFTEVTVAVQCEWCAVDLFHSCKQLSEVRLIRNALGVLNVSLWLQTERA